MSAPKAAGRYDVVVIGSGHNGLTTAALLAKRGRKVLVLEKRAVLGGLAAAEEFHPGFKTAGVLHDTTGLRPWAVEQLGLAGFGLKFRSEEAPIFNPSATGRGLLLWRDPRRAEEEIGPLSAKDAKAYAEYRAFTQRVAPFLGRVFDDFPPDVVGMSFPGLWDLMKKAVSLRMLGKSDMMEILRIAPMCVADWLNEWFENDLLKSTLAAPSIFASFTGPWSPGTNANLLLAESFCRPSVVGGPQAVAKALLAACKAHGVEIRANAEVAKVLLKGEDNRAYGVQLVDGTIIEADRIAAACDPKQLFLKLVEPTALTQGFEHNIKTFRSRGTTAKVTLALNGLPSWRERPSLKAEYIRTGNHFDEMERAFDSVKYKEMSAQPLLDMYVPTLEAPELAPNGQHVLSILAHFAPFDLKGGWNDARRDELYGKILASLETFTPGVSRLIVGKQVLTPADLEGQFNLSGGHLFHGEHASDQLLVRPTPECSRYATPFPGLYLCGSGAHPGGGITCAPGAFAARVI